MGFAGNKILVAIASAVIASQAPAAVQLGIDVLAAEGYAPLKGKRVGLITNQTGVNSDGVRTRVLLRLNCNLVALYTPEHGLDGTEKAGRYVRSRRDPVTGLIAHSLYGPTRKPTPDMLRGVDLLVFDIQDIGCRSYTYISTMGKCMEAAAENRIAFMVLDRPNPLGGLRVEGPSVDPRWISFVGQFPVPYVHGLTCGELAKMINARGWINGHCDLEIVPMRGWSRDMTWNETGLRWVPSSPNIPRGSSPLYYVATGMVGELGVDTGVGSSRPFESITSSALSADAFTSYLRAGDFGGVSFSPYRTERRQGCVLRIQSEAPGNLTAINVYTLAAINRRLDLFRRVSAGKREMFFKVYGSSSIQNQLARANSPENIVSSWNGFVANFRNARAPFLLY